MKQHLPQPFRNLLRPLVYSVGRQFVGFPGRLALRGRGRLPELLIIGAQKSGTTSLYDLLVTNDAFGKSALKEVAFFDRFYNKGVGWYKRHFISNSSIMLDATPDYLFDEDTPRRIQETYSSPPKFIVMLRHPSERAISHYFHSRRLGFEPLSLSEALAQEKLRVTEQGNKTTLLSRRSNRSAYSYVSRGYYAEQISHWLSVFPRKNFYFIQSEKFFEEPAAYEADLCEFLGLENLDLGSGRRSNKGRYDADIPRSVIEDLDKRFAGEPGRLEALTGLRVDWAMG